MFFNYPKNKPKVESTTVKELLVTRYEYDIKINLKLVELVPFIYYI